MFSKSSSFAVEWLFLAIIFCGSCASKQGPLSPFELVDNYVEGFKTGVEGLKERSLIYKAQFWDYDPRLYNESEAFRDSEEYDFIIVGSGASGSALANRLSEVPEWKVLLLEAGDAESTTTQVPSLHKHLQNTPYSWSYTTTPQQSACLGLDGQECSIGRGKALGGNTAVNDMLYTRGHPKDYDTWSDAGLLGWCWNSVYPYFRKIENNYAENLDRKEHQYGGPVHIEEIQYSSVLADHVFEAGHEMGLKKIDLNGKQRLGLGVPQVTTKDGIRNSASQAYLSNLKRRKNVQIKSSSEVVKVLISPHTKEANGVQYICNGKLLVAKATKEVILSAGAINTAKLLLLSGVGPKEALEKLEIPVVADTKVGYNLKDKLTFLGLNFIFKDSHQKEQQDSHQKEHQDSYDELVEYLKNGKGPLTTTGLEVLGFVKSTASKETTDYPDIELLISRNNYDDSKTLRLKREVYESIAQPLELENKKGFTIQVVLLHPKSSGVVQLVDRDPLHPPSINPNYLSDKDEEDIDTLLAGVQKALKLVSQPSLVSLGVDLSPHRVPQCDYEKEDDYWKCAIKYLTVSLREPSGTARMGPDTDKQAVVDQHLKVYGVHKLRVADASVIPVTISGHLMAAEIMIGEQAADLLKKNWLKTADYKDLIMVRTSLDKEE